MTTASMDGSPEPLGTKTAKPTLYHYWRSSSSWRVRWALMLKGVDFEAVAVNLLRGEQQAADYVAKNPQGLVPLLTVPTGAGGVVQLSESMAILEYLEEVYPQPALLPVDALGRARVRQLSQVIVADTQPLQNLSVLRHISSE
nr:glutathione S-transferase N-terminal domain-containing protein [Pseudomonadota bacterium]